MQVFWKHATNRTTVKRSLKTALLVGSILSLINHYDSIFFGTLGSTIIFKIILNYFFPYCVATFGAAAHARHLELESKSKNIH